MPIQEVVDILNRRLQAGCDPNEELDIWAVTTDTPKGCVLSIFNITFPGVQQIPRLVAQQKLIETPFIAS